MKAAGWLSEIIEGGEKHKRQSGGNSKHQQRLAASGGIVWRLIWQAWRGAGSVGGYRVYCMAAMASSIGMKKSA